MYDAIADGKNRFIIIIQNFESKEFYLFWVCFGLLFRFEKNNN